MKRILMTVAALTLGTSALAWAPADKPMGDVAETKWSAKPAATETFSMGVASAAKMATWESAGKLLTKHEDEAKPEMASLDSGWDKEKAEAGLVATAFVGKEQTIQTASLDVKPEADGKETGMGGPLEVATGYPPCDPGPGDDRCIQLYERGVPASLAQWKGTESEVAMGGPFEPVPEGKPAADEHQGMDHSAHGTGTPHAGHGSATATQAKPPAPAEDSTEGAVDTTGKPGAVGGPYEPVASYPPCRPGRGDDRCIQLYERGVTGKKD